MVWGSGWIEVGSSGIWPDRECMRCCQGGTRIWLISFQILAILHWVRHPGVKMVWLHQPRGVEISAEGLVT